MESRGSTGTDSLSYRTPAPGMSLRIGYVISLMQPNNFRVLTTCPVGNICKRYVTSHVMHCSIITIPHFLPEASTTHTGYETVPYHRSSFRFLESEEIELQGLGISM